MTSSDDDGTTHLFNQTVKKPARSAFRDVVDEPGNGNSEEYRLSHRGHHLLPELDPLENALASGERCLHQ